jgi:hypothetical protein
MADLETVANQWVRRVLRSEMVKRDYTYADLGEQLVRVGIVEDERNLRNKIARGTFSAAFFAQCLAAMGVKTLQIDLLDHQMSVEEHEQRNARRPVLPEPGKDS